MPELAEADDRLGHAVGPRALRARRDGGVAGAHAASSRFDAGGGAHDRVPRGLARSISPATPALEQHEHAVGHAEHLGQLATRSSGRRCPAAASSESSRCTSALVPTSMPAGRLVDDQERRVGARATWPARPSAGCRPRASTRVGRGARTSAAGASAHSAAKRRSAAARDEHRSRRSRSQRGERDVALDRDGPSTRPCWRRSSGTKPMPAAIAALGERRRQRRAATAPPSRRRRGRCRRSRARPRSARRRRGRPARRSRPRRTSKETSVKTPSRVRRVDREDGRRRRCASTFGKSASSSRPTIERTMRCGGRVGDRPRCDVAAVAHHRDALAEREDLVEPVGDEEHRRALARSVCGRRRRGGRPRSAVSAAVGSSMTITRASSRERLGDLDDLLVGDRQPAREAVRVQVDAELARRGVSASRRMRRRSMRPAARAAAGGR